MKLQELYENTVKVNQRFADLSLGSHGPAGDEKIATLFDFDVSHEDRSDVEEPLGLIVNVITPIENDYRGQAPTDDLKQSYAKSPELAFYIGEESGRIWMEDLLNEPGGFFRTKMNNQQFWKILQAAIIN